jgi:hypothetical protein
MATRSPLTGRRSALQLLGDGEPAARNHIGADANHTLSRMGYLGLWYGIFGHAAGPFDG